MNINRRKNALTSSILGVATNLILFVGKILIGLASGSIAVLVDAFNSLSDAASAFIAMVGFSVSGRRKTKKYPFGYGRIEYISGMIISMIIMFTAIVIGQASFERIINPISVEFSWIFIIVLIVSILIKLGLFIYFKKINKSVQSGVLTALARDSFFDALATVIALLPLIFSHIDFPIDGVAGLALSVFILISGLISFIHNAEPVLGLAFKQSQESRIRHEILKYDSFARVRSMQLHNYGVDNTVGTIEVELSPKHRRKAEADLIAARSSLRRLYNLNATIFWRN
ncbi:cation diffusion facilitator family transporter [Candidatus Saccharibacteria bacterium]|nr:cation diffusion facilitator family transporter [Candidatus Saccharibacteria bacterium]